MLQLTIVVLLTPVCCCFRYSEDERAVADSDAWGSGEPPRSSERTVKGSESSAKRQRKAAPIIPEESSVRSVGYFQTLRQMKI